MERILLDEVIRTDYGQFDLSWDDGLGFDGDWDRVFEGQMNGLVGAAHPGGVYINLARRSGGSPVRILLCDSEPHNEPSYQDVVEVSVKIPPEVNVRWMSWAGESSGTIGDLAAGTYRVRVNSRGRDSGHKGEFVDGLVDEYLIQVWLAPAEPDAILRIGSQDAEYWHREIGGRR